MHNEASGVLYWMTEFQYSGMAAYHSRHQPAVKYHEHIRTLTVEHHENMALTIDNYTKLRRLTIGVPSFLILDVGAMATGKGRSSNALRQVLHVANGMPDLPSARLALCQ